MSFNGSGTFLINSTGQPVVANTVISATVFNALTADLASGLTNCITKDGQSTPTANIPMGSNKITGLANGTLASDAANLGQVQTTAAKLIGTIAGVDTITGIMSPTLTAYAAGQLFYFIASGANTGAVTLNIDGLGAKSVTRDGSTALAAGDINSGEIVVVIYDGTRFQMINAANSFGNTTINGTLTVTGKSNLAEVSTPSINASVAAVTALTATGASVASANVGTAVITSLQATGASAASINAGVALLTTATVTNLQATGASIASANIGNLQFTAASIASINAGVAVINSLTATSASIASANVGTALVTRLDVTGASAASMNADVALITTGTVTNLTSTAASIASANVGTAVITTGTVTNLTATNASVASANAGTAVVTNLTATGASIASANVGTGVVTTLTATQASVGSINAAVALVTNGTVTTLSGTQASITSINHAVVRLLGSSSGYVGLQGAAAAGSTTYTLPSADGSNGQVLATNGSGTLSWATAGGGGSGDVVGPASATDNAITRFDQTTGKLIQNSTVILDDAGTITGVAALAAVTVSVTSANAGTATLTGNLTLNGGTANGVLYLNGSKVATSGSALTFDGNGAVISVNSSSDALRITQVGAGNAIKVEDSTNPDASPFVVTSDGLVGVGVAAPVAPLSIGSSVGGGVNEFLLYGAMDAFPSSGSDSAAFIARTAATGSAPFDNAGSLIYRPRVTSTTGRSSHIFYTGSPSAERLRINESGNVGIGTTTPAAGVDSTRSYTSSGLAAVVGSPQLAVTNAANFGYPAGMLFRAPLATGGAVVNNAAVWAEWSATDSAYLGFATTNSGTLAERMRITAAGSLMVGVTSTNAKLEVAGIIKDAAGDVRSVPQSGSNKTTTYTLSAGDNGEFVGVGTSGKIVIPNAVMSTGNVVTLYNATTGNVTVECSISIAYIAGTNTDKASVTLATRGVATILFLDSDNCVITGNVT